MSDSDRFRVYWKADERYTIDKDALCLKHDGTLLYCGEPVACDIVIVEFCTGRRDRNGTLIYFGDVLKDWRGFSATVAEDEHGGVICIPTNGTSKFRLKTWMEMKQHPEIVGTVHDKEES